MPSKKNLAKIHIAKKELGLTDEVYRDILRNRFKVESARDLTDLQAATLLSLFRQRGWRPAIGRKAKSDSREKSRSGYIAIRPGPAARQQRKVLAMWAQLGYEPEKLHGRCKRQFGIERFEWVTEHRDLHVLITDLDRMISSMTHGGRR
ncbi:MAG TPA: regulatory protein GemA [Desulfobacteraceae bacterium]|nr:regulatory protein GemA [Desulfobacteraceae bacterium]